MTAAGILLCALCGLIAGVVSAAVWNMLKLPVRAAAASRTSGVRTYGAALALGGALGAWLDLYAGAHAALPAAAAFVLTALGGAFVGMIASGLTEALEVVPLLKSRAGGFSLRAAAVVLALGKLLGALYAATELFSP